MIANAIKELEQQVVRDQVVGQEIESVDKFRGHTDEVEQDEAAVASALTRMETSNRIEYSKVPPNFCSNLPCQGFKRWPDIGGHEQDATINHGELNSINSVTQKDATYTEKSNGLRRQSSVYSLTLDDFRSTFLDASHQSFASMNMEEFVRSVWAADGSEDGMPPATIESYSGGLPREKQHPLAPQQSPQDSLRESHSQPHLQSRPQLQARAHLRRPLPQIPRSLTTRTVDDVIKEVHQELVTTFATPASSPQAILAAGDHLASAGIAAGTSPGQSGRAASPVHISRMRVDDFLARALGSAATHISSCTGSPTGLPVPAGSMPQGLCASQPASPPAPHSAAVVPGSLTATSAAAAAVLPDVAVVPSGPRRATPELDASAPRPVTQPAPLHSSVPPHALASNTLPAFPTGSPASAVPAVVEPQIAPLGVPAVVPAATRSTPLIGTPVVPPALLPSDAMQRGHGFALPALSPPTAGAPTPVAASLTATDLQEQQQQQQQQQQQLVDVAAVMVADVAKSRMALALAAAQEAPLPSSHRAVTADVAGSGNHQQHQQSQYNSQQQCHSAMAFCLDGQPVAPPPPSPPPPPSALRPSGWDDGSLDRPSVLPHVVACEGMLSAGVPSADVTAPLGFQLADAPCLTPMPVVSQAAAGRASQAAEERGGSGGAATGVPLSPEDLLLYGGSPMGGDAIVMGDPHFATELHSSSIPRLSEQQQAQVRAHMEWRKRRMSEEVSEGADFGERRQKRMIKNRESAARSRARKQVRELF